jgi:16S rRNA (guanine966-N2)-methyltransferase
LRIVGGTYKGRKIEILKGFDSRATTDFAKVALFNILANHFNFELIKVLDLFCGTGSISFEFASRGCAEIDLVDASSRSIHFIKDTADRLGIQGLHPVRMNVFRFIPVCKKQYNLIFADPPYQLKYIQEIPGLILENHLLLQAGWLIMEHSGSDNFSSHTNFFDERKYGNVHFSFFRLNQQTSSY